MTLLLSMVILPMLFNVSLPGTTWAMAGWHPDQLSLTVIDREGRRPVNTIPRHSLLVRPALTRG